jgi:hypothetical protein
MPRPLPAAALALAPALLAAPLLGAAAPRPAPPQAEIVRELTACRATTDDAQRLACYDKAAGALSAAQEKGEVVVVDRQQLQAVRRQAFGLHLPTLDLLPHARAEAPLDRVSLTLRSAGRSADGKWVMVTDEGAQWLQTDSEDVLNPPHAGSQLAVRSGVLGSFFCKVDGQSAFRCRRQN